MFSPMVAMASAMAVSTVVWPTFAALIFSMSAPTSSATCAIILTSPWNCSLRATKSVSELTSTTTPLVAAVTAPISPSAATPPAFFADGVGGVVIEFGQLPVVEDAEIVELLLDCPGHAGELLEVVGGTARPGEPLEARSLGRHRNILPDRMGGCADVDSGIALRTRDAVDDSAGYQIAVQRDGAASVIIAGDDIADP